MIPALLTSSSALDASQTMLSVVGNNLANTNTAGYKAQTLLFADQFSQILQSASQPTATSGGSNPIEVGMGVQVGATDTNETEGTFQSTGNPLDLAIQNSGYFVLQNGNQTVYSRSGAFAISSSGYLIDPSTGAFVQRVGTVGEATSTTPGFQTAGDSNIYIPSDLTIPGQATQNIDFSGNLSSNSSAPTAQVLTSSEALTVGTQPATLNSSLDSLDQTSLSTSSPSGYAAGDVIDIMGTTASGQTVKAEYTLTGDPTKDTVGALIDRINQVFQSSTTSSGMTATLNSAGQIVLTANQTGVASGTLTLSTPDSNASGTTTAFSTFQQTTAGATGTTATATAQIYDSQGTAHNVTFTFEKMSDNTWNITASMAGSDGTITGFGEDNTVSGVTFNSNGSLATIAGGQTAEALTSSSPLTSGGAPATLSTTIQSLDQTSGSGYGSSDTITISGTDYNGKTITPVTVPASGTVGDIITAINSAYGGAVATLDASGNIELSGTHSGQSSLSLNITDSSGNSGTSSTVFPSFDETTSGTNGDSDITFQVTNDGVSQTIALNLGTAGGFSGVTQTGAATSVNVESQDGYAEGSLESTSISSDGVITGEFTNGETESLAQIALATFNNPEGLENAGSNYLTSTTSSGLANISAPGAGSAGTIESGGLEGSNVDVGTEFTNLIAAQQGYEVNAKAFSIANAIMTAAVNLISQ